MSRVLAMLVTALAATAVVAAIATAEPAFETKKVTIKHPSAETFTGKVKAGGGCKADRTVKVTKVEEYGGGGEPAGATQTDSSGAWTLTLPSAATPGGYKAVAKKDVVIHGDTTSKCKKGTSKVINVN